MIIRKDLVKIEIKKLLDRNGVPFSTKQAYSFTDKDWGQNFVTHAKMVRELLEDDGTTKPKSKEWIHNFSHFHSIYRVQNFLLHIQKGKQLPPIDVRYGHRGLYGYVLIDGRHRCWAYILNGDTHVPAYLEKWVRNKESGYSATI